VAAKLAALVVPLGLDTFAVSAALGVVGVAPARRLRITLLFTAFEAGMPLLGLAVGAPLGHAIGTAADYVAAAVLMVFGLYTLFASPDDDERRLAALSELRGPALLLGVSISLDEMAVGFSLGLLRLPIGLVIGLITFQAFVLTQLGLRLGDRLSERLREGAERVAGLVLALLGLILLLERVLA
jgi:putative Mn2+ efflux pump MntP